MMTNAIKVISYFLITISFLSCTDEVEATVPPCSAPATISGTLPVLYIDTENHKPIVSKEEYLNAFYRIDPMGIEGIEALAADADTRQGTLIMEREKEALQNQT